MGESEVGDFVVGLTVGELLGLAVNGRLVGFFGGEGNMNMFQNDMLNNESNSSM